MPKLAVFSQVLAGAADSGNGCQDYADGRELGGLGGELLGRLVRGFEIGHWGTADL